MTDPAFRPGDRVVCLDDSRGAHFLRRGEVYTVESTQRDDAGGLRLNLEGMARAWEAGRFRRARANGAGLKGTRRRDDG